MAARRTRVLAAVLPVAILAIVFLAALIGLVAGSSGR